MTQEQAYLAMYYFLDGLYALGWDELGGLLGSMSLLSDGSPADSAMLEDWKNAVKAALDGKVNANLVLNPNGPAA